MGHPQTQGGCEMLTTVLAHLLPDEGADLFLLPSGGAKNAQLEVGKSFPQVQSRVWSWVCSISSSGMDAVPLPTCWPRADSPLPSCPDPPSPHGVPQHQDCPRDKQSGAESCTTGSALGRAGLTHLLSSLTRDTRHTAGPHHCLPRGASFPL